MEQRTLTSIAVCIASFIIVVAIVITNIIQGAQAEQKMKDTINSGLQEKLNTCQQDSTKRDCHIEYDYQDGALVGGGVYWQYK